MHWENQTLGRGLVRCTTLEVFQKLVFTIRLHEKAMGECVMIIW